MSNGPERAKKSIALVGLPGAGKTTVGRALAERLVMPFTDSDAQIEAAAGHEVAEIFARCGEAHFRALERQAIARLTGSPPQVIATGGGAFIDPDTHRRLRERCLVVWLDGDVALFAARAVADGPRPLLDAGDPAGSLGSLATLRNPIYARAHLRVDCGALRPEEIVDLILPALRASHPPR